MPSFPELTESLAAPGVALRLNAERDIPEILIAHQDDPELYVRLGLERPPSGAELGRRCEGEPSERAAGTALRFTILTPDSDACRGQLDVHRVDWEHGRAELGIWVAPAWRGRGLARVALLLAARWLLEDRGLHRVELLTEPDNQAMIRAAEAAGFVREGVLRGYLRERGGRVDVCIMSLLAGDLSSA